MRRAPIALVALAAILAVPNPASAQDLYVSIPINHAIVRISPDGKVSPFATFGYREPRSLTFDARGNLDVLVVPTFINSKGGPMGNPVIETWTPTGVLTRTVDPHIDGADGLAADKWGNLYVGGSGRDGSLKKIMPNGVVRVFCRKPLGDVSQIAIDKLGNLFVIGTPYSEIFKVSPDGRAGVFVTTGKDCPSGLAVDSKGNVFARLWNALRKYSPKGVAVEVVKKEHITNSNMAFDTRGNLFVADFAGSVIEKIAPDGKQTIFTHDGLGQPLSLAFGPAPAADHHQAR